MPFIEMSDLMRENEKLRDRVRELETALWLVKETYENITTQQFQRGADKPAREAVDRVLGV